MSLAQPGCRACRGGNTTRARDMPQSEKHPATNVPQYALPRQDSRMLASKVRYSVLKNIETSEKSSPKSNASNSECFIKNQYCILDMFEGDELESSLAKLALEDLENIVTQETKDISCALTMARKNNVDVNVKAPQEEYGNCRRMLGDLSSRVCDIEEDMSAETIAKMMYAGEIKSALTAPPQVIYNLLFDDADIDPLAVNTAAPNTHLSHLVVPLGAPSTLTDPLLEDAARINANKTMIQPHPDDNSETSEDLEDDIINQVLKLTTPSPDTLDELLMGVQQESAAALSDFNILMEPYAPEYQSLHQLRGSVPPSWFPEHYAMFPDSPLKTFENIENPMEILERAWEAVQPAELNSSQPIRMIGI